MSERKVNQVTKGQDYFPTPHTAILCGSFHGRGVIIMPNASPLRKRGNKHIREELWDTDPHSRNGPYPTYKSESEQFPFFFCICIKSPERSGIFVNFKIAYG